MKHVKFYLIAILAALAFPLLAQVVDNPMDVVDQIKDATTWEQVLNLHTAITAAIILVVGYLSPFVPFIRKIPKGAYQVLALAAIVVIILVKGFAFGSWIGGVMAYFFSTSMYELIFKWIGLRDSVKEKAVEVLGEPN